MLRYKIYTLVGDMKTELAYKTVGHFFDPRPVEEQEGLSVNNSAIYFFPRDIQFTPVFTKFPILLCETSRLFDILVGQRSPYHFCNRLLYYIRLHNHGKK